MSKLKKSDTICIIIIVALLLLVILSVSNDMQEQYDMHNIENRQKKKNKHK